MIVTVYFIQRGDVGPIKIGGTRRSGETRMKELQTGSVERLRLLGTIQHDEVKMRERFKRHRISGEWFRPHREILSFVMKHTKKPEPDPPSRKLKEEGRQIAIRISRDLYSKVLARRDEARRTTGIRPSVAAAIRAMIGEVCDRR